MWRSLTMAIAAHCDGAVRPNVGVTITQDLPIAAQQSAIGVIDSADDNQSFRFSRSAQRNATLSA
jgi:hypothetical protein